MGRDIEKNRGLTRERKKIDANPRVKNREKFRKLGIRPEQREQCATEEQEQEAIAEAVEYEATRHMFYDATRESA